MTTVGPAFGAPGIGSDLTTIEKQIFWGGDASKVATWFNGVILSSTTDDNNTPTTVLRPGLVLGRITSTGKFAAYDPTATNGAEIAIAVLAHELRMTDFNAVAGDRVMAVCVAGNIRGNKLIESGATSDTLNKMARAQMHPRFIFDDDLAGNRHPWENVVAKTADYTVLLADNNKMFTTLGASATVSFTLPAVERGLRFRFHSQADQTMKVISVGTDDMVVFNDLAADNIYFETASEIIGGVIEVTADSLGTSWLTTLGLGNEAQGTTIDT